MGETITSDEMRALERAAMERGSVTGLELMERAGQGVVEAIAANCPDARRAVVLCGPGNNGGDGFVVARLLKERGWEVEVFLYGDAENLPPDAKVNYERWTAVGEVQDAKSVLPDCSKTDLCLDAMFGTGLTRTLSNELCGIGEAAFDSRGNTQFVAVDILSGVCADSGKALGDSLLPALLPYADLTVTFHRAKLGHVLAGGANHAGQRLRQVDIGIAGPGPYLDTQIVRLVEAPKTVVKRGDHKFTHGHALVLSGPPGAGGAARLAARGALRIGAGLVTLGCPLRAVDEHAHHLNAIMVKPIDGAPGLREALEDPRFTALCLGMGLGLGRGTHDLVMAALESGKPVVLDADALSRFQRSQEELFKRLHPDAVLTPHGGEFKRLFPDLAERLEAPATTGPAYSKVDATREAAARAGCTVLFKGPDTVIASPDGNCAINASLYDRAAPWLATAGSGDVLAGFIAGLLARGFPAQRAAEAGAWLHTECALSFGPGLIAEDLPEELPKVFRKLEG